MKQRLVGLLVRQFGHPKGLLGRIAGWIMAGRPSNRKRNSWTIALLDIGPADRVLEIGYGPGLALADAARLATSGKIVGIDHSHAMFNAATVRNRRAIGEGRMELKNGSVEDIDVLLDPTLFSSFDHIYAVNVTMFWPDLITTLKKLAARLVLSGQIALTFQPRTRRATDKTALCAAKNIRDTMQAVGLINVKIEYLKDLSPMAVCVIGRKSEAACDRTAGFEHGKSVSSSLSSIHSLRPQQISASSH